MRGKAQTDTAALVAQEIISSIKDWVELSKQLMQAGSIASDAEFVARSAADDVFGPKGLLYPAPARRPPPAEIRVGVEAYKAHALRAYQARWSETGPYVWLSARPDFSQAMQRLLISKRGEARFESETLLREAAALELIVSAVMDWAVLKTGASSKRGLRLYLNRKQMDDAAVLAAKLHQLLGVATWSGSATTKKIYQSGLLGSGGGQSLREILWQLKTDLQAREKKSSRSPRNDPGTADRWLIATLANRFRAEFGAEHRLAIREIVKALGVNLTYPAIKDALDNAPNFKG